MSKPSVRNGFVGPLKGCPEIIEVVIIVYSTLVEGNGDGVTNVGKACGQAMDQHVQKDAGGASIT